MSTDSTLKALIVLSLVLASMVIAMISLALARQEGRRWTIAIRQAALGFTGSATLLISAYSAFIAIQ
ncbi:hypothetical protein AB0L82_43165 [Nocardia sp. NPDC052001]|uniref:hypothetical protein n=1 Tax=Nocardia sp. NPDC052001 TaxID=3154853 RepID=UPI0034188A3A